VIVVFTQDMCAFSHRMAHLRRGHFFVNPQLKRLPPIEEGKNIAESR
jgi:hypothetical protein